MRVLSEEFDNSPLLGFIRWMQPDSRRAQLQVTAALIFLTANMALRTGSFTKSEIASLGTVFQAGS